MADRERLYFTIGPVQTFVAQSRRTRDLWASSYLLSHMADVAMAAVEAAGGGIILPSRKKQAGQQTPGPTTPVQHGRWPNRFVAVASDSKSIAKAATSAMFDAWQKVADAVWTRFVQPAVNSGNGTRAIWDRQVGNFWEVSWVVAHAPAAGGPDPLSLRKNWRTTPATVEPGDHCTMMGSWQELSGYIRSRERKQQDSFWATLRNQLGQLDLGEDERLCAIALIKRTFPRIAKEAIGSEVNAASWLSTPYIAAIPWLKRVSNRWPRQAQDYLSLVKKHRTNWRREDPNDIASLRPFLNTSSRDIFQLDADLVHETALKNASDTPLDRPDAHLASSSRVERNELLVGLDHLYRSMDNDRPSSFYAMLLMDGDSMGRLLSEARASLQDEGERQVTAALGQFAAGVPETIGSYDGVTVYCGGDDVLAMLPMVDPFV